MKNTKKMAAISIVIAMLALAFMPLTKVHAVTTSLNQIGFQTETVPVETNLTEYINTKKAKFMADCADAGITEADLTGKLTEYDFNVGPEKSIYLAVDGILGDDEQATVNYVRMEVSKAKKKITTANVTIVPPKAGDKVVEEELEGGYKTWKPEPTVQLEANANYRVEFCAYISAYPSENREGYDKPFVGTFEEGKEYYVEVYMVPNNDYEFAENVTLNVTNATSKELSDGNFSGQLMFYAKVKAVANNAGTNNQGNTSNGTGDAGKEEDKTTEAGNKKDDDKATDDANQKDDKTTGNEDKKGDDKTSNENNKKTYKILTEGSLEYTLKSNKQLVVKADGDDTKCKGINVDKKAVNEKFYLKEHGSTIIKLKPEFLDTLEAGMHELTILYPDGEVSASFKIAEAKVEEKADTKTEESNKNEKEKNQAKAENTTTAKDKSGMTNPQTGDIISIVVGVLAISILTLCITLKKRNVK